MTQLINKDEAKAFFYVMGVLFACGFVTVTIVGLSVRYFLWLIGFYH